MLIVDPATGAMCHLPPRVDITLDPAMAGAEQDTLTITTIDSLTPEQREAVPC
ncbi:MAG: hypothetical protein ACQETO_06190 [Pseudomonadota bacterium]